MAAEKILIVDDERLVRWSLRQKCEEWGYHVLEAESGEEWADAAVRPVVDLLTEGQATGFFRDDIDPLTHARQALVLQLGYFAIQPVTAAWGDRVAWRDRAADLVVRGCTW